MISLLQYFLDKWLLSWNKWHLLTGKWLLSDKTRLFSRIVFILRFYVSLLTLLTPASESSNSPWGSEGAEGSLLLGVSHLLLIFTSLFKETLFSIPFGLCLTALGFIPSVGTFYSQAGNVSFPTWELDRGYWGITFTCYATSAFRLRIKATCFEKDFIPPVKASEALCLKASCQIHHSLHLSPHLSRLPYPLVSVSALIPYWLHERWWERYGRDRKHPSHAQIPLYKGTPRDLGRDDRFMCRQITLHAPSSHH